MDNFGGSGQGDLSSYTQKKQVMDSLRLFSRLVDKCFTECIQDFHSKTLTGKETACVSSCIAKFIRHSERVGLRFMEQNAALQKNPLENMSSS